MLLLRPALGGRQRALGAGDRDRTVGERAAAVGVGSRHAEYSRQVAGTQNILARQQARRIFSHMGQHP